MIRSRKGLRRQQRVLFGLKLESLEDRRLLAVGCTASTDYCVETTNDSGSGSLRQALTQADGIAGDPFWIDFNIPGNGPHTIAVDSQLPDIDTPTIIDGRSQPGFTGSPIIVLSGANAGNSDGLRVRNDSGTTEIRSIVINQFALSGIYIRSTSLVGNRIVSNYIGVDVSGSVERGNKDGIFIDDSSFNSIGGAAVGDGNLISGNTDDGIDIRNANSRNNEIIGNLIGTDLHGTLAIPNGSDGIQILDSYANTVGGSEVRARNLISGNGDDGIDLRGETAQNNVVQGNFIGTDISGTTPIPNGWDGVHIGGGASANTIGGNRDETRNIISGNGNDGIDLRDDVTSGNLVVGNFIGSDES